MLLPVTGQPPRLAFLGNLGGLAKACHPAPTVAVTVLTTLLFVSAGAPGRTCVLGALAILTGQLSIGWSNDLIDRARDLAAGRTDKPLELDLPVLRTACVLAVLATVPASLALGWRSGLLHLVAVGFGWAYNLGLKARVLSPLPYLVAFGSLPIIATSALSNPSWPPAWSVLAAGLIGAGAHFANVLPDLAADLANGVRGLPQRLGASGAAAGAGLLSLAATAVLLAARPGWLAAVAAVAALALVAAGLLASARGRPASAFQAIMLCAAVNVGLIVSSGGLRP
jgi:4-hydroxybenzoate polyprenyltransferase